MISDEMLLISLVGGIGGMAFTQFYMSLNPLEAVLFIIVVVAVSVIAFIFFLEYKSKWGRARQKRLEIIRQIPLSLLVAGTDSIRIGYDHDLKAGIFLPDSIRRRHVHILGSTGSGKSESVILNFLRQDVARGLGAIMMDAKGDASFLAALYRLVPKDKLRIFDLGDPASLGFNPLEAGAPLEAAQRIFSSLTWSEEYYKSKAFLALQKLFQNHFEAHDRNPTLVELSQYLDDPETFIAATIAEKYPKKMAEKDYMNLSGLRDQIQTLCMGHLEKILSPENGAGLKLEDAAKGYVLYFRLQSLMSPQLVATVGKLLILIPTYLDEFASFACPEFADLISKARSAGLALHFSHQSIGDLTEVSEGFLNRIIDNSGTKIVMRINDPDSAEYFARTYGTKFYRKTTQRITNAKEVDRAEVLEEGTQRDAHQFRASPDLFKTLPTGVGFVLIAHGDDTPNGASHVFKIRFPRLETGKDNLPMIINGCRHSK